MEVLTFQQKRLISLDAQPWLRFLHTYKAPWKITRVVSENVAWG